MKVLENLNVYGWSKLEPVIMASLASEDPLLLIGKHGCAKSLLLETLSKSLNMEFRNYNASLIDYDDLVGIPVPSEDKKSLNFISNKNSIWDAEVVFMDEINRCKPELQNKLFPLIYDKRIQGSNLEKLKYRWAAMNPPFGGEEEEESYLGAFPLDPALMDRFSYIIHVPTWNELSDEEKINMLNLNDEIHNDTNISECIELIKEVYKEQLETYGTFLDKFLIRLMELMGEKFGYISARRAKIIKRNILYVHASRIVLSESDKVKLEDSANLTLQNSLPFNEYHKGEIFLITKNAFKEFMVNKETQEFLRIKDDKAKLVYGVNHLNKVDIQTFYENIPTILNRLPKDEARVMGLCLYLKLKDNTNIPAFIIEQIFHVCAFDKVSALNDVRVKNIETKLKNKSDEVKMFVNLITLVNNNLTPANTIKMFETYSKEMKL